MKKLRKALQEKPYYAEFDEQGRFNRNSVVAQNTKSISLVACRVKRYITITGTLSQFNLNRRESQ